MSLVPLQGSAHHEKRGTLEHIGCLLLSEFVFQKPVVILERKRYKNIPASDTASRTSDPG